MLPPVLPDCTCPTEGVEDIPMIKTDKTKRCTGLSYRGLIPGIRFRPQTRPIIGNPSLLQSFIEA
jgi:hypothetical protein